MRLPQLVGERDPILRAGRRTAVSVVVMAIVGAAVAGLWYLSRPIEYSSTVAMELTAVTPVVDLGLESTRDTPVTQDTDAQIMVSDDVVDAIVATVGGDPQTVRQDLAVRARPLTRVLELTFVTSESAEAAQQGVTAAAEAYLDQRDRLLIYPMRDYLDHVITSTVSVQRQFGPQGDFLTSGQSALENRLERAQTYQIQLPTSGSVIASPSIPKARRGTVDVILVSGAVTGALVGLGIGLLLERRARHRTRRTTAAPRPEPVAVRESVLA